MVVISRLAKWFRFKLHHVDVTAFVIDIYIYYFIFDYI